MDADKTKTLLHREHRDHSGVHFISMTPMTSTSHSKWRPPAKPDPRKILGEARADSEGRRYADALAKHVWFHKNALKYRQSLYGVRLSFALGDWRRLGYLYPPALTKLKSVRHESRIRVQKGRNEWGAFHDFVAINHELGDHDETKKLFVWLDSKKLRLARRVYSVAESALVRRKAYKLCGKYIDGARSYQHLVERYRITARTGGKAKFRKELREFAEKSFAHGTSTLVALLVLNGRKPEAENIAVQATKEWKGADFRKQLRKALRGGVPEPWPR